MKHTTFNAINLKSISRTLGFSCFFFIASLFTASAQNATDSSGATVASVTYVGYENDKLFFSLKYENESGGKYTVSITGADGDVLFTEQYADKKFSKTFKVPSAAGSLTFVISNPKNKEEKKFKVSAEGRFKEEYSVTKIKQQQF